MKKRYEILDGLPPYGPMYVPVSWDGEPFYSEGFVVEFYKDDGTNWVANFKPGSTKLEDVIPLINTPNFLVIAQGECYIMAPDNTVPIAVFGGDCNEIVQANNRLILSGNISLTIIEPDGTHWHTERISWDGLKNLSVKNGIVSGLAYNPISTNYEQWQWIEFTYDINTKILTGGSYNWHTIVKKPWWKFW